MTPLPSSEEIETAVQCGTKTEFLGKPPWRGYVDPEIPLGHVVTSPENAMVFYYFFHSCLLLI